MSHNYFDKEDEQREREYLAKYHERNKLCGERLQKLRQMPSALFTVQEIGFLLHSPREQRQVYRLLHWDDHEAKMLRNIWTKMIEKGYVT